MYNVWGGEGYIRDLVGKPGRKRPLGRPRTRQENNIKMDLQEVGLGHGLDWSGLGYGQVLSSCEFGNELKSFIKCWEFFYLLVSEEGLCSMELVSLR